MKTYKVWMEIEERDDEKEACYDRFTLLQKPEPLTEFGSKEEAIAIFELAKGFVEYVKAVTEAGIDTYLAKRKS